MKYLCSTLLVAGLALASPALAVDTQSPGAPDLGAVRAKIEASDFKGAAADLNAMIDAGVQHPDVYNLLGLSLRRSGDTKTALTYYQKALDFDPNHKGALEYEGELYVEVGDIGKARDNAVSEAHELSWLGSTGVVRFSVSERRRVDEPDDVATGPQDAKVSRRIEPLGGRCAVDDGGG